MEHHPVTTDIGGGIAAGTIASEALGGATDQSQGSVEEVEPVDIAHAIVVNRQQVLDSLEQQPLTLSIEQGLVDGVKIDAAAIKYEVHTFRQMFCSGKCQRSCGDRRGWLFIPID